MNFISFPLFFALSWSNHLWTQNLSFSICKFSLNMISNNYLWKLMMTACSFYCMVLSLKKSDIIGKWSPCSEIIWYFIRMSLLWIGLLSLIHYFICFSYWKFNWWWSPINVNRVPLITWVEWFLRLNLSWLIWFFLNILRWFFLSFKTCTTSHNRYE